MGICPSRSLRSTRRASTARGTPSRFTSPAHSPTGTATRSESGLAAGVSAGSSRAPQRRAGGQGALARGQRWGPRPPPAVGMAFRPRGRRCLLERKSVAASGTRQSVKPDPGAAISGARIKGVSKMRVVFAAVALLLVGCATGHHSYKDEVEPKGWPGPDCSGVYGDYFKEKVAGELEAVGEHAQLALVANMCLSKEEPSKRLTFGVIEFDDEGTHWNRDQFKRPAARDQVDRGGAGQTVSARDGGCAGSAGTRRFDLERPGRHAQRGDLPRGIRPRVASQRRGKQRFAAAVQMVREGASRLGRDM